MKDCPKKPRDLRLLNRQGEEAVHPEDEHDDRQTQDHVPHPHALEARGNPTEEQH